MLYRIISRLPVYRASYQALKHLSEINTHTKQNYAKGNKSLNVKNVLVGVGIIVGGSVGYYLVDKLNNKYDGKPGSYDPKLPVYTLEEISSHDSMEKGVWVIYKQGVYDITDFINGHPGGEQILMAAGSSVEPFWMLYGVHQTPEVSATFEEYRMGNVRAGETKHLTSDMSDPYAYEPKRHFALIPASAKPFNAELPPDILIQNFITPNELFYVRNHLPVPEIDPKTYELEIEIEGKDKTLVFTLDELKKMPKRTITATIMCAGNRRSDMIKHKPVRGLNWGAAAVGTATWTGVPLRDILLQAGIDEDEEEYKHIQFEGIDADVTARNYGASIPIWKALDKRGDVILAYEMNGVPIPRDHGFPVRVIVPGVVGARNVKWLGRIVVSDKESDSHWQQNDYKGFSPSVDWDTVDFTKSPAIQELPVISAICKPSQGSKINVENGVINVKGYAWSGGGQQIVRVDVTADGGKTWHVANFDHQDSVSPPRHWAWTLWSVNIPVDQEATSVEIWSKAVDSAYNTQPESVQHIWNLRGVLSNAYHKIKVNLKRMDN